MNYSWPLNDSQFTFLDRLKICKFFLNTKNRWTQDVYVKEFEKQMAKFVGSKYAVFVSSGSAANTLVTMWARDHVYSEEKKTVVLPAVTWQTSCSPWIREGFVPHFIDVNLQDLSIDLDKLEKYLEENHKKVAVVFVTSLLGFCPDIERLKRLESLYPSIKFSNDNCESTLTDSNYTGVSRNISVFFTSTTSTYFGHSLNSNEGGFIFTNNLEEYIYFIMNRSHGMVRTVLAYRDIIGEDNLNEIINIRRNPLVDSRFDFYSLGNNFRNTDINAFIGLQDFKRANLYKETRRFLFKSFSESLNERLFIVPKDFSGEDPVPFSLPIIFNPKYFGVNVTVKNRCVEMLDGFGCESRPIISGNLLRQTAYKDYDNYATFKNAEILNSNGLYIGLHAKVTNKQVDDVCKQLNKLAEEFTKI